ncbi:hypothetical protein NDU88_001283 [Pleurodeles waltl]|uniref:Uncharacterized protein n=1 Tax=Pleurodeles waltl TaxID=8319 RepID=A0AAV7VB81_PLEWA|nr:hypothetical protein NDU88_001283 [Pleurodeles waltl]
MTLSRDRAGETPPRPLSTPCPIDSQRALFPDASLSPLRAPQKEGSAPSQLPLQDGECSSHQVRGRPSLPREKCPAQERWQVTARSGAPGRSTWAGWSRCGAAL